MHVACCASETMHQCGWNYVYVPITVSFAGVLEQCLWSVSDCATQIIIVLLYCGIALMLIVRLRREISLNLKPSSVNLVIFCRSSIVLLFIFQYAKNSTSAIQRKVALAPIGTVVLWGPSSISASAKKKDLVVASYITCTFPRLFSNFSY